MELELIPGEDGLADLYLLRDDQWPRPLIINEQTAAAVVRTGQVEWPQAREGGIGGIVVDGLHVPPIGLHGIRNFKWGIRRSGVERPQARADSDD